VSGSNRFVEFYFAGAEMRQHRRIGRLSEVN
jgi:hypothetical protein